MKKLFFLVFFLIFIGSVYGGEVVTFDGKDIGGSPLREGARTVKLPLSDKQIKEIQVRWRAKAYPKWTSETKPDGWLFLDGREWDHEREIDRVLEVESWDNLTFDYQPEYFEIGVGRDQDNASEIQVDVEWIRVEYF